MLIVNSGVREQTGVSSIHKKSPEVADLSSNLMLGEA
jgi:hypothetical protein